VLDLKGPLDPAHFSQVWTRYNERWRPRNERIERIDRAARGEWTIVGPGDKAVNDSASPNLILTALEDTAEAASLIPSVRVKSPGTDDKSKKVAAKMEQIGTAYLQSSEIELVTLKTLMHLAGHGIFSWVEVKKEGQAPELLWRDPRMCYPEPNRNSLGRTDRCFFAQDLRLTQLPAVWRSRFEAGIVSEGKNPAHFKDHNVTLVEYYDADETVIAGIADSRTGDGSLRPASNPPQTVTVILEHVKNETKRCPVTIGQRISLDNEPRGQFDQVINVMEAHIKLQRLVLDYAAQGVYSDIYVKDLIGKMPYGGGSYIQLGPQGEIGRVAPAVTSMTVYNELQSLVEGLHLGGRWPKTRPGDIEQNIASGKFLESSVGMMNTVIRTYHLLLRRALKEALTTMFALDKASGEKRTMHGRHKNQPFTIEVDTATDIDLNCEIDVTYGLGLGRDPAQSMVLGIQASQAGIVSMEFVQENFEGIEDVNLEKIRVDVQALRDMMFAEMLTGVQSGTIPKGALVEIMRARLNGEMIHELFEKYVAKPAEEMQAAMMTSGLGGGALQPGQGPAQMGGMVPPAPPPEELMAGLMGGAPPAGPPGAGAEPPATINRTSVSTGPGSFSGVQSGG
jgi:hypothetical protein